MVVLTLDDFKNYLKIKRMVQTYSATTPAEQSELKTLQLKLKLIGLYITDIKDEQTKFMFTQRAYHGLSHEKIGQLLGLTEGAIRAKIKNYFNKH